MVTATTVVSVLQGKSVFSATGKEVVIMSIAAGRYYSLNAVGARFWALIQQPTSIRAAATTIVTEFDAPQDVVEQDLIELVGQFLGAGLVEVAGSSPASP